MALDSSSNGVVIEHLAEVDFEHWRVDDVATLTFVRDGALVLLIHKKRGHGAGKINAPGGKVEPGESPLACARRETLEEVGLVPEALRCMAELRFQDSNGYAMRGFAFVAESAAGTLTETAEARPFWCPVAALPFDSMWDDDRFWLPRILDGECLVGEFLIRDDRLIEYRLRPVDGGILDARSLSLHPDRQVV